MNVLIVAPNWLGDAVMALPAIADVRRATPDATITVIARPSVAPLYQLVNAVGSRSYNSFGGIRKTARASVHDTALLLPNSFHAALDVWRARIPERWGYRTDCRGMLLTRGIDRPRHGLHQVDYYRHLVRALGFPNGPAEPRLDIPDAIRDQGKQALARAGWDGHSYVVGLAPGAAYGGAKRWPPEYFAELARALAADGITTAMLGSAADRRTGQEIVEHLGRVNRTLNLIGATDLTTLAGVLVHCRALVTNDSGAMHVAAALGVRVTAVFGPTNEHATGPRGDVRLKADTTNGSFAHAVLTTDVACRPCMLRECPIDHRCMRGIGVGAVLAEARRTL